VTAPIQQPLTDGQAALVEQAQLRIAAQRMRLAERREEAGKLQRTTA
jgi:hypothetical protein